MTTVIEPNLPEVLPDEEIFRETLFDTGTQELVRRGVWLFCRTPLDAVCREKSPPPPAEWRLKVAHSSCSGTVEYWVTKNIEFIEEIIGCSVKHLFAVMSWVTCRLQLSPCLWLDTCSWFEGERDFVYTVLTTNNLELSMSLCAATKGMKTAPSATMACLCASGRNLSGLLHVDEEGKRRIEESLRRNPIPSEPFRFRSYTPKVYRSCDFLFDLIESESESESDCSDAEE